MELLKSRTPTTERLTESLPPSLKIQTTPTGDVTAYYNNILIHSVYNPVKEGRAFASKVPPGSRVCLYGFGLGYHVASLLERVGPDGYLLVIELNPDLLSAAMALRDQTGILKSDRFHLVFGSDEAEVADEISDCMSRLQDESSGNLEVLFHPPSFKCVPAAFPRLTNSLEVLLMERRFPAVLGDAEKENYLLNQEIVRQSAGINDLKSAHRGKPGILVSAGPSLDDILPYLQQIGENAILACVDTALPILSREGIAPQYVFSLDPQEDSFRHFREDLESPVKLVFTPTANSKIVHCYQGEKYVVFKEGHSSYKEDDPAIREKGATQAGGSVSCLALDALIQFGCNPVILTGQDLAFPSNRSYSSHSTNNEQLQDKVNDENTLTNTHFQKTREKKTIRVTGSDGREVVTNQMMYSYLRAIEAIAAANPETSIYNLCSHGAQIDHVTSIGSVNELLKILR
ncbi:hypothetical protein UZ36_02560 [Candidatus Nitromaritima sp. SCGC AAA799-C22]|nr:hypothetical protein UZ36_02560 [Candidatus Nitromaritima sp. SCGC AAA799-C22]